MNKLCLTFFFSFSISILHAQSISFQEHKELGDVHWIRDYDTALQNAKAEDKAVLILFQEVPGCSTCRNYGNNVLTHPLIVETIENFFVPLTIFNNKKGKDLEVLRQYNEPTWNNPVVRIVNASGKDIVKRVNGNYSKLGLIDAMMEAIIQSGHLVPDYLDLLYQEFSGNSEECYLSMYCFWTGEKEIAKLPGVISTQAGFMNGKEVVKVQYNKNKTSPKKLKSKAAKKNCGDDIYLKNNGYRIDRESKYYLRHSDLQYIPMTITQATKVNSALGAKEDPLHYLSPQQIAWYKEIKSQNNSKELTHYVEVDFRKAWNDFKR